MSYSIVRQILEVPSERDRDRDRGDPSRACGLADALIGKQIAATTTPCLGVYFVWAGVSLLVGLIFIIGHLWSLCVRQLSPL